MAGFVYRVQNVRLISPEFRGGADLVLFFGRVPDFSSIWASSGYLLQLRSSTGRTSAFEVPALVRASRLFLLWVLLSGSCCPVFQVLSVSPLNVKANFRRTIAFKHLGSPEAARKDLLRALEVELHNKDIIKKLGAINLDRKGKRKVGEDTYEVSSSMNPSPLREQIPPKNESYPLKSAKLETSDQDKMIVDVPDTGSNMNSEKIHTLSDEARENMERVSDNFNLRPLMADPYNPHERVEFEACSFASSTTHPIDVRRKSNSMNMSTPSTSTSPFHQPKKIQSTSQHQTSRLRKDVTGKGIGICSSQKFEFYDNSSSYAGKLQLSRQCHL